MRLVYISIFLIISSIPNVSFSQDPLATKIDLNVFEEKFSDVLNLITQESGIHFSYNSELFSPDQKFTLKVIKTPVEEVLRKLLVGTTVDYAIFKDQIIFSLPPKEEKTYEVQGVLLDSISRVPIHNAHIYLDGTEIGAYTNYEGEFTLRNVPYGAYELVISHLSYGVRNYYLSVNDGLGDLEISVPTKALFLDEIQVLSSSSTIWMVYYNVFVQEFLGTSANSEKCFIKNPEVVNILIDMDSLDDFEVFTTEPLIIENQSLGYQINYDLLYFKSDDGVIRYYGKSNFVESIPFDKRESKKWRKKRLQAYNGSLRQFIYEDIKDEEKRNKFKTKEVDGVPYAVELKFYPGNLKSKEMIRLKKICDNLPEGKYLQIYHGPDQFSYIGKLDSIKHKNYLKFNEMFDIEDGIMVYGYWSEQRLADALPLGFYLSLEE